MAGPDNRRPSGATYYMVQNTPGTSLALDGGGYAFICTLRVHVPEAGAFIGTLMVNQPGGGVMRL